MKDPIGWEEMEMATLWHWLIDDGTPEDEIEKTAEPIKPRRMLKYWSRGKRYVRVCEVLDKDVIRPYVLHYGFIDDPDSDDDKTSANNLDAILLEAKILMRVGGY